MSLLFHFGVFFLQSVQMNVFSAVVTLKDCLLESLCIHVLVSIIESVTISISIALAGFRFPVRLKQTELLAL